jgi:hypothetical protein
MKRKILENGEASKLIVLGFLLAICLLTHLFYVPIILASLWWPRKGIFVAVFLALQLLVSHLIIPIGTPVLGDIARALMFILVGTVVATLSEKKQILEDKLRTYGRTLEQQVEETIERKATSDSGWHRRRRHRSG